MWRMAYEWSQLAISVGFHADTLLFRTVYPALGIRTMRERDAVFAFGVFDAATGRTAEAEAQMSPCEKAMTLAGYATHPAEGTPLLEQYATGLAAPLAWIDVAGYCSGRFAEGTLRDAQTKQWLAFLADKFGQSAPEVTPARLDGVTSANVDRSVLDAMAVARIAPDSLSRSWPHEDRPLGLRWRLRR